MYILEGEIELFQNSVPNKHIDLDFIMDFVNKLYQTRRVERKFDIDEAIEVSYKYLKYPPDVYKRGEYFLENSDVFTESILPRGVSFWCPFYIEKDDENRYFLRFDEFLRGTDFYEICCWLIDIHERFFFLNDIYSKGELTSTSTDGGMSGTYYFNEDGIEELNEDDEFEKVRSKSRMERNVASGKWEKYNYYPKIFDYMAEEIEQNIQKNSTE